MSTRAEITRPWDGRLVAGVCAGLADRTGIDANLLRAAFIVLALAGGIGVIAYGLLWLFLPPVGERRKSRWTATARTNLGRARGELAFSSRKLRARWGDQTRVYRLAALGLVGGGALLLLWSFGAMSWMTSPRLIAVAAIIAGLGVLLAPGGRR